MATRLLYLVRHGETDWNAAERWQGHTDVPLNARGRGQARAVAAMLNRAGLAGVVSSDLSRARETAEIIAVRLGIELVYVDAALRERAFGPFEGLTREQCARLHPREWQAWCDEQVAPEGAENRSVLAARVALGLRRAAEEVARDDAAALVVTHGGSLRAVVAEATGTLPPPIANGAVWRVAWDHRIVSAEAFANGG
jgi:broad specificity phosphatase PhoE